MLRKYATLSILDVKLGSDGSFTKSAHRVTFDYTPRPGYLYVRSRAISSRCNDNFDAFPAEEIEKSYLTFIGKPVFVNHHNEDHRRARGVIIDAALHKDRNPDGSPDTWAEVLMEVDALRFPRLAKAILAGEIDRTSMGCDVQFSKCSACGNVATSPLEYCAHIPGKKGKKIYRVDPKTGERKAQLIFEICSGLSFFENSLLVEAPADPTAFFLGGVELGPGLEHLTASMSRTASRKAANKEQADRWIDPGLHENCPKVVSFDKTAAGQSVECNDPNCKAYHWASQEGKRFGLPTDHKNQPRQDIGSQPVTASRRNTKEGEDGPVPLSEFEQPKTGKVWEMIYTAVLTDDDLYDRDFVHTAGAQQDHAEEFLKQHPIGVHHILNRVEEALNDPATTHSGMKWYEDAHGMAKTMAQHHEVPLEHVAGALGVYSSSSAPAPNFHYASVSLHSGRGIYSKPVKDEKGKIVDNKGYLGENPDYNGTPMAAEVDGKKVDRIFGGESYEKVIKSNKTRLYARIIHNPKNDHDVVVDRHAVAAAIGHQGGSGEVYNHVAGALDNKNGGNSIYDRFAQAYRDAAHVLNTAPSYSHVRTHLRKSGLLKKGESIKPHQVQAMAWIVQKGISDSHGHDMTDSNQKHIDLWQKHYTDRYGPTAHQPHSGEGFYGQEPTMNKQPRTKMATKLAYGETKSPQDVDTLRSENCTVCGNSSAWDGTQCQVCGYVAPPRPFGDPDTDIAKQQDIRKQVIDGDQADPNDPSQQLGNQVGNPDEVQDQEDETAAGDNTQMQTLTCNNCGTGIVPTPPDSDGQEPPYPAEGDVCPVCKKGQLLGNEDEEPTEDSADQEEGEEGDDNGASQNELEEDDGDAGENSDSKGTENSDDDDKDDDDSFDPKDKKQNKPKTSSWQPVWWKPIWWQR